MSPDTSYPSAVLLAKPRVPLQRHWALGCPLGLVCAITVRGSAKELRLEEIIDELPPFVPLVITAAPPLLQEVVRKVRAFPRLIPRMLAVFPQIRREFPSCGAARILVNRRPAPSTMALARWLQWRLTQLPAPVDQPNADVFHHVNPTMLAAAMAAPVSADGASSPSLRTIRRWAATTLRCRRSDLRRLAELAKLPRLARNVDQLAAQAGTTPTRLRERVSSALGLSLLEFNGMAGWEPVLEAAVLHGLGDSGWGVGSGGGQAGGRGEGGG